MNKPSAGGSSLSGKNWRPLAFLLLFASACALAVVALNRHVDPDLFWQLRAGKDIAGAGKIVLPDSWTYLFQGRPWVNQQWLTQLLFYSFFSAGGYGGLEVLKGLLVGAMVLLVIGALKAHEPIVRYACALVFLAGTAHYMIFRTHLMSLLCMAALLFLLERFGARARLLPVMALFALWADLHGLFVLGLWVLGSYALVRWLQNGRRFGAETVWEWASVPLSCAATLANPFGWGIWKTVIVAAGDPATGMVTEWWPVWRHSFGQNLGFFFVAALLALLIAFFPKNIHWPGLLGFGFIAFMGVLHVRFTADCILPAIPLVASLLSAAREKIGREKLARMVSHGAPALAGALLVVCASSFSYAISHPLVTPGDLLRVDYPVRAVAWMKRHHLAGRIFNEYTWGGYIVWELPESRVFIDPRTGVLLFPRGFVGEWKDAVETKPGWRETLERGRPDFVLLVTDNYLSAQLAEENDWELLFKDGISVLYGRRPSAMENDKEPEK
jgi:hypothetical protein